VKVNRDEILNRWQRGEDTGLIAAALNFIDPQQVYNVVSHARRDGDPRAVYRDASIYAARTAALKVHRRWRAGLRKPVDPHSLDAAVQKYSGPVKECPLGFHSGYRPKVLKDIDF